MADDIHVTTPPELPARRSRQRRKEARPTEILAAAMALWAERGFAATRLEDVAKAVGITKGTIYLYFPSKVALFEAALKAGVEPTISVAEQVAVIDDGHTAEALRRFLAAAYGQVLDGGTIALLKVLVGEGHRFPALIRLYEDFTVARSIEAVHAILARGEARGDLRPGAADIDPRLVVAPVLMSAIWSHLFGTSYPIDRAKLLEDHVKLLMTGLGRDDRA